MRTSEGCHFQPRANAQPLSKSGYWPFFLSFDALEPNRRLERKCKPFHFLFFSLSNALVLGGLTVGPTKYLDNQFYPSGNLCLVEQHKRVVVKHFLYT